MTAIKARGRVNTVIQIGACVWFTLEDQLVPGIITEKCKSGLWKIEYFMDADLDNLNPPLVIELLEELLSLKPMRK